MAWHAQKDGRALQKNGPCTLAHNLARLGQVHWAKSSTTSLLTATTLAYAIGAGITAAAGTRLALQWILDKGFGLFSFQLSHPYRA